MSLLHIIFHGPIKFCCNVSRARPGAGRGSGRSTTVRAIHPMLRGKAAPMPGVEDLWTKTVRDADGNAKTVPSARHGAGLRWRARYVDDEGRERTKAFGRKLDAKNRLNQQVSDQVTGTWTDHVLSGITFGVMSERWLSTLFQLISLHSSRSRRVTR